MKQRLIAAVCCLAALVAVLIPWCAAAGPYDGVYLVGINDTVLLGLISQDQMPVRRSGVIFAPCDILGNSELGLSYAINKTGGTFTVYNRKRTLIFQLNGAGSADKEGNTYTNYIITRNGVVYIPLRFVCTFFGLSYSFFNLLLPDGTVPIARVCTDEAILSDQQFGTSATQLVESPLKQYLAAQTTPLPSTDARPGVTDGPDRPSAPAGPVDVSFAVVCSDGSGFSSLLDALSGAGVSALFLFSPDDLVARDQDVRSAAALGHQIGLLLPGEEPAAAFARGNALLEHILRAQATQVAFSGTAAEGEWWVWAGNVSVRGRSVSTRAANLREDVDALTTARVTLDDSRTTAQAFLRNVPTWRAQPYRLSTPTESSR